MKASLLFLSSSLPCCCFSWRYIGNASIVPLVHRMTSTMIDVVAVVFDSTEEPGEEEEETQVSHPRRWRYWLMC